MGIVHDQTLLAEAARALVAADQSDELPALGDEIKLAYQEWRRGQLNRSIGEAPYISQLAKILTVEGIDGADAWAAVRDAVRPSWPTVLCSTIIQFAERLPSEVRRSV